MTTTSKPPELFMSFPNRWRNVSTIHRWWNREQRTWCRLTPHGEPIRSVDPDLPVHYCVKCFGKLDE